MKGPRRSIITIINFVLCLILIVMILGILKVENKYDEYLTIASEFIGNIRSDESKSSKSLVQEESLASNNSTVVEESSTIIFRKEDELTKHVTEMLIDGKSYNEFTLLSANTVDIEIVLNKAMEEVRKIPGYYNMNANFKYSVSGQEITIAITYLTSREKIKEGIAVADYALGQMISDSMTDYEKLLLIHDYLINGCIYPLDYSEEDSDLYNLYGLLVEGYAVCNGYADAFHYMANKAGIETIVVNGEASGIDHAWNMVLLEGAWYHVDVTWDDPLSEAGQQVLVHSYFNVTNEEILKTHSYDVILYPLAMSREYNYYNQNGSLIGNEDELMIKLEELFKEKGTSLELKVTYAMNQSDIAKVLSKFNSGEYTNISYSINEEMNIFSVRDVAY